MVENNEKTLKLLIAVRQETTGREGIAIKIVAVDTGRNISLLEVYDILIQI